MDSKRARDLVDTDNLKKQLRDVAAQVKDGETVKIPFTYMYGAPIDFIIKRDISGKLSIEPDFIALSTDEQQILEEPVRQSIESIIKNQPPVMIGPQTGGVAKGLLSMHSIFAKRPAHQPDTKRTIRPSPNKPTGMGG